MRIISRSEEEINELLNELARANEDGTTHWRNMTYEQGAEAALLWLFGDSEDHPLFE